MIERNGVSYKVKKGMAKVKDVAIGTLKESDFLEMGKNIYLGLDLYLGDDLYLSEFRRDNLSEDLYQVGLFQSVYDEITISYYTSPPYTEVVNKQGITYRYYFNQEGNITSQFEYKNEQLYTLKKNPRFSLMERGNRGINGRMIVGKSIGENLVVIEERENPPAGFINTGYKPYYETLEETYGNYVLSCYLRHTSSNASYMKMRVNYPTNNSEEVYIDHKAVNAWQYVEIPLVITKASQDKGDTISHASISVLTDGWGSYEVSDVRLDGGPMTNLFYDYENVLTSFDVLKSPNIRVTYQNDTEEVIPLGQENYLTGKDIIDTLREKGIYSSFTLRYCGGKKRIYDVKKIELQDPHSGVYREIEVFMLTQVNKSANNILITKTQCSINGEMLEVIEYNQTSGMKKTITDFQGRVHESIDYYGKRTINTYDYYGNIKKSVQSHPNTNTYSSRRYEEEYIYDDEGSSGILSETLVRTITNGKELRITETDRNISFTNGYEPTEKYTYDEIGRVKSFARVNSSNQFTYDDEGRLDIMYGPGNCQRYKHYYDDAGNLEKTSLKLVVGKEEIISSNTIRYDDNTACVEDQTSARTQYYDNYGKLLKSKFKDTTGEGEINFTYHPKNVNISTEGYENFHTESDSIAPINTVVDGYSGLTTKYLYRNGSNIGYEEMGCRYLKVVKDRLFSTNYTIGDTSYKVTPVYDRAVPEPLITKLSNIKNNNELPYFTYLYNYHPVTGGIISKTSHKTEISYSYDDSGYYNQKISKITQNYDGNQYDIDLTYDIRDKIISTTYNGKTITYNYDGYNQLINEVNSGVRYQYNYTQYNRLYSVKETVKEIVGNTLQDITTITKSFEYDDLGRITAYIKNDNSSLNNLGLNDTMSLRDIMGLNDMDLSDSIRLYTYSGNSLNPSTIGGKNVRFIQGGRLAFYGNYTYTYSASGVRVSKYVDGVTTYYYYDGNRLLGEDTSTGEKIRYFYDLEGIVGARHIKNNTTNDYQYLKDGTGNVIGILKDSTLIGGYQYDAWGNVISIDFKGSESFVKRNPIRYKGYYFDNELGYYYLMSRYYDPCIGAFITPDSPEYLDPETIGGLNLFTYCLNNPVISLLSGSSNGAYSGREKINNSPHNSSVVSNSQNSNVFNSTIVNGKFRSGLWFGKGSVTGLYADGHGRAQVSLRKGKFVLGAFGKFSLLNATGQTGFGTEDINFSLKGIADIGTVSGMAGILLDPSKDLYFLGLEAKASVITGRVGAQFEIFGTQIEAGVSGEALAIGGRFGVGFKDGEFYLGGGISVLFGWDVYIRIKFW